MNLQRVTLRLRELRCIAQSERGGSEPYLWVTYFSLGAEPSPDHVAVNTPAYQAFRSDFPDNVEAGQTIVIPPLLAEGSFDIDLDGPVKLVGCIGVLLEEDETPDESISLGWSAYSHEIEKQLTDLIEKRIHDNNMSDLTDEELQTISDAVAAKVEAAVGSDQSIWDVFRDQDDTIGFTYASFMDADIYDRDFDFPQLKNKDGADVYVLSGGLSVGPVPSEPVDPCGAQRTSVAAKKDEIGGLQARVTALQTELQHAAPSHKGDIVREIEATNERIAQAEAELPALETALEDCVRQQLLRSAHGPDWGRRTAVV